MSGAHNALLLIVVLIVNAGCSLRNGQVGQEHHMPFMRVAELEIDPAQLENCKAAVRKEIKTSIDVEPGVLAI